MAEIILKNPLREIFYKFVKNPLSLLKYRLNYGREFTDLIHIGTTTYCNLRCKNCPHSIYDYGLKKNEIKMDEEVFKKLIDDLAKIKYSGEIAFCFFNEPFADDRFFKFISYIKERLSKLKGIPVYTNGFLLTLDMYKKAIAAGVSEFTISEYETIPKALPEILKYDQEHGKHITFRKFDKSIMENVGGELKEGNILEKARCTYPDNPIMINPKGEVVLCCNDYHSSIVWGNIKNETLFDIFNKPEFKKFRKDIKNGKFDLEICKKCRGIIKI